jgi:hypothetical protein
MRNNPKSEAQTHGANGGSLQWHGSALSELAEQTKLEIRRNCMPQVDALLMAGWKYELPEIANRKDGENFTRMDTEPWQWYWRAPSKRAGGKGRRYLSTNQAFNALQREAQNDSSSVTQKNQNV